MRLDDNTYSRVVAWAKVLLPLLALALLSTLFLVARTVDPAQKLPFADIDVDAIAREQRIGAPKFNGVTKEGTAISLSADSASPDPESSQRMSGDKVLAEIDLPSGEKIRVNADIMDLDYGNGIASLANSVRITSDSGYELATDHLEIALDSTRLVSNTHTTMHAQIGQISANSFELLKQDAVNNSYVLVFKGGVKLLYTPNR